MKTMPLINTFGLIREKLDLNLDNQNEIRKEVLETLEQEKYIIFKNQVNSSEEFLEFSNSIGNDFVSYKGGAYVREKVKKENDTLLSVTGGSGMKMAIPMHGEMHYKRIKPPLLWFCCISAPISNGETTLCDAETLYQELSAKTKDFFQNNRIQYIREYEEEKWKNIFQVENIMEAIPFFESNGLEFEMGEGNQLTTKYFYPANHESINGKKCFINNILPIIAQEEMGMEGNIVRLENGNRIPNEVIKEIENIIDDITIPIKWEKGDVVLIDNFRVMHGRNKITCDNRQIIVRMSD